MLERANDELMQSLVAYRSRLRQLKRVFSYHERMLKEMQLNPSAQFAFHGDEINHQIQDAYEKMER